MEYESEQAQIGFMVWEDWAKEVNLRPLHVEKLLASTRLKVAGTTDLAAEAFLPEEAINTLELRNEWSPGVTVQAIFDWKTSKRSSSSPNGIYKEAKIQVCAYREMAIEMGLLDSDAWAVVVRLPKSLDDPCIDEKKLDTEWIDPERALRIAAGYMSIRDMYEFLRKEFK